jgi:AbiV family abortive infection protein
MTHLSVEDLVDGMIECADNARKLAADAARMYGVRRYSTAGALAIFSLEESGKVLLLSATAAAVAQDNKPDWNEFWRNWKKHDEKVRLASLLDLGAHGKDAANLAMRAFILGDLSKLRESFIYVDRKDSRWLAPKNQDRDWVLELLDAAEVLSERLASESNRRRRKWIIEQFQTHALDPTHPNPFVENLTEGLEAIQEKVHQINREIEGSRKDAAG